MSNEGMITLLKDAFQLEVEGWLFYRDVIGTLSEGPVRDVFCLSNGPGSETPGIHQAGTGPRGSRHPNRTLRPFGTEGDGS